MAKYNLVKHYLVVGITEQLGDFVAVLEAALPRFFAGATQLYQSGMVLHCVLVLLLQLLWFFYCLL